MRQECKICGRTPHEIPEYTEAAEIEEMAVEAYVEDYEGTYNFATGKFYCTKCYIEIGEPLGTA